MVPMTYRVGLLVTGTRGPLSRTQHQTVRAELEAIAAELEEDGGPDRATLYVGDADGVDNEAMHFFRDRSECGLVWEIGPRGAGIFVADWRVRGHRAGPERNERMVDQADLDLCGGRISKLICLAFPALGSIGTWDCVRRLAARGIPVRVHGLVKGVV